MDAKTLQTQTPQRTLMISELLRLIFGYLDGQMLSVSARVCKTWLEDALDALWEEFALIVPLLNLLSPTRLPGDVPQGGQWVVMAKSAEHVSSAALERPPI